MERSVIRGLAVFRWAAWAWAVRTSHSAARDRPTAASQTSNTQMISTSDSRTVTA